MKTKIGIPIGLALVMFLGVFTAMLAFGTLSPEPTQAQTTPSATRSFRDPDPVMPRRAVDGDHQFAGVPSGAIGAVTETLPTGFSYVSANWCHPGSVCRIQINNAGTSGSLWTVMTPQ